MVEIISMIYLVIGMLMVTIGPYRKKLVDDYKTEIEVANSPFSYMFSERPKYMRLRIVAVFIIMAIFAIVLWPVFITSIEKVAKRKSAAELAKLEEENKQKRQKLVAKHFEEDDPNNWKKRDTEFLGMKFEHDLSKITIKSDEFVLEGDSRVDAVEQTPEYKAVIDAVRKRVDEELKDHPWKGGRGYCHAYWGGIERILREEHGIRWRSPAKMNPWIMYD